MAHTPPPKRPYHPGDDFFFYDTWSATEVCFSGRGVKCVKSCQCTTFSVETFDLSSDFEIAFLVLNSQRGVFGIGFFDEDATASCCNGMIGSDAVRGSIGVVCSPDDVNEPLVVKFMSRTLDGPFPALYNLDVLKFRFQRSSLVISVNDNVLPTPRLDAVGIPRHRFRLGITTKVQGQTFLCGQPKDPAFLEMQTRLLNGGNTVMLAAERPPPPRPAPTPLPQAAPVVAQQYRAPGPAAPAAAAPSPAVALSPLSPARLPPGSPQPIPQQPQEPHTFVDDLKMIDCNNSDTIAVCVTTRVGTILLKRAFDTGVDEEVKFRVVSAGSSKLAFGYVLDTSTDKQHLISSLGDIEYAGSFGWYRDGSVVHNGNRLPLAKRGFEDGDVVELVTDAEGKLHILVNDKLVLAAPHTLPARTRIRFAVTFTQAGQVVKIGPDDTSDAERDYVRKKVNLDDGEVVFDDGDEWTLLLPSDTAIPLVKKAVDRRKVFDNARVETRLVPREGVASCEACGARFGFFGEKKKNCSCCGRVFCGEKCAPVRNGHHQDPTSRALVEASAAASGNKHMCHVCHRICTLARDLRLDEVLRFAANVAVSWRTVCHERLVMQLLPALLHAGRNEIHSALAKEPQAMFVATAMLLASRPQRLALARLIAADQHNWTQKRLIEHSMWVDKSGADLFVEESSEVRDALADAAQLLLADEQVNRRELFAAVDGFVAYSKQVVELGGFTQSFCDACLKGNPLYENKWYCKLCENFLFCQECYFRSGATHKHPAENFIPALAGSLFEFKVKVRMMPQGGAVAMDMGFAPQVKNQQPSLEHPKAVFWTIDTRKRQLLFQGKPESAFGALNLGDTIAVRLQLFHGEGAVLYGAYLLHNDRVVSKKQVESAVRIALRMSKGLRVAVEDTRRLPRIGYMYDVTSSHAWLEQECRLTELFSKEQFEVAGQRCRVVGIDPAKCACVVTFDHRPKEAPKSMPWTVLTPVPDAPVPSFQVSPVVGQLVVRHADHWTWGGQDGMSTLRPFFPGQIGNVGVVTASEDDGQVRVKWQGKDGCENVYRWGSGGKYDVRLVATVGSRVVRNPFRGISMVPADTVGVVESAADGRVSVDWGSWKASFPEYFVQVVRQQPLQNNPGQTMRGGGAAGADDNDGHVVTDKCKELAGCQLDTALIQIDRKPENELGKGAFGLVYKGEWDGQEVAVKEIEFDGDESTLREIVLAHSLLHPHIAPVHGWARRGDRLLVVMPLYPSGSLQSALTNAKNATPDPQRGGPLGWAAFFRISIGILRGLRFLATRKPEAIIHRDMKPANVLMSNGQPAISDFGLARTVDPKRGALGSRGCGTLLYASPEQLRAETLTPASDIFSYGCILWQMLYSPLYPREPFVSQAQLIQDIQNGEPLRGAEPCDRRLQELIDRCTKARAAERPSHSEILEVLEKLKKEFAP